MTFGPGQTGHLSEHNRLAEDLAYVQATYVTENEIDSTLVSSVLAESSFLPRQIYIGNDLNVTRPEWAGPVYWVTTVVDGIPTNIAAGDQIIEVSEEADTSPTVVWSDDFDRSDGGLGSTAIGSKSWVTPGSIVAGIESNQAKFTSVSGGTSFAFADGGTPNGTLTVTIPTVGTSKFAGIVLRYVDLSNNLGVARTSSGNFHWRVIKRVAGTVTTVYETSVTATDGDILAMTMDGTDFTLVINGSEAWTGSITEHSTSASHGLMNTSSSDFTARFDNASFYTLGS